MTREEREAAALAELTDDLRWRSEPRALAEIAARMGYTVEWIRVVERRALAKLRKAAERQGRSFDDFASTMTGSGVRIRVGGVDGGRHVGTRGSGQ